MSALDNLKMTRLKRYHVDQLARLHEDAFDTGWAETDFLDHLQNDLDDLLGLVDVGDDGKETIRGFILTRTLDDQSEILTIVVGTTVQGQGLGRALLKSGERTAKRRGATIMFLEVASDNPAAISLYKQAGYQRCGTRKSYYRRQMGRVDALLFQKKLI